MLLGLLVLISSILSVQAQSTIEDNLYKFDGGFYEKIQNMQNAHGGGAAGQSSDMPVHSVIIITDEGHEDRTEQVLQELGAQNIFVSSALDFLIADVPINNIVALTGHDFIYKLGDGQEELISLGLSMSEAKAVVGASNIGSHSYSYTGDDVTVAVVDTLVDFTHPDLQNKRAGYKACDGNECISSVVSGEDHGTGIAAIIAANSADPSKNGIAPDAMIYSLGLDAVSETDNTLSEFKSGLAVALDYVVDNDLKIVVSSRATSNGCDSYSALTIIMDRAVKEGLSLSIAIGNSGGGNRLAF